MSANPQYRPRDWTVHPAAGTTKPLVRLDQTLSERTGPVFGHGSVDPIEADLTRNAARPGGVPIGERIVVTGRVLDEDERPIPDVLIEIWQTNAAGRYSHQGDQHDAPIDPNFYGTGRCITDREGRYRFLTIRPAAYPLPDSERWRPSHIHYSLIGPSFGTRLVTQNYFAGDPFLPTDPLYNKVPDEAARQRLIAQFSKDLTEPGRAIGYRFDIVLRGRGATPMES